MATGRGITDTKIYDREAVIDRYGIPPELVPDFVGLKGDTSDNIPGVPGIGDKTASQLLQEWGDLEGVLANIDSISGRQAQGEPDRARRGRAHLEAAGDRPARRRGGRGPRPGDRARARPLAAARGVPGVRAARAARAPRGGARRGRGGARRAGRGGGRGGRARGAAGRARRRSDGELVAVAALRPGEDPDEAAPAAPEDPEAELAAEEEAAAEAVDEEVPVAAVEAAGGPAQGTLDFDGGPRGPLTVAAWAGDEVLVGEAETLAAFSLARGERPVVAHDWKTIAMADDACAAPPLAHDTMVAAYLIDPARRGYPLDELAAEAGWAWRVDGRRRRGRARRAHPAAGRAPARAARGGRADRAPPRDRAAAGGRAGRDGARRREARRGAAARDRQALRRARGGARAARLGAGRGGVHDRLAAAARADPVREARPVAQAPRQDRLLDGRARAPGDPPRARDRARDRGVARGHQAQVDLPRRLPRADRRRRPAAHDLQPDGRDHRPAVEHQPEPPEHPDPHRAGPRDPRLLRGRARARG